MPEWLTESVAITSLPAQVLFIRIGFGLVWGLCVAGVYLLSHGRHQPQSPNLVTTLVMLSGLIAMVSIVIGNDIARAFSLVGALSIVRFRTVVEDTRDTAFVIFAVIVGMAAGAGQQLLPLISIPVVGLASIAMNRVGDGRGNGTTNGKGIGQLTIRTNSLIAGSGLIEPLLDKYFASVEIRSLESLNKGAQQEYRYRVRSRSGNDTAELIQQLQRVEGVESVKIRYENGMGRND